MRKFKNIKGLEGSVPFNAIVTAGIKSKPHGNPVETDRFHFLSTTLEKLNPKGNNSMRNLYHPHDPAFRIFNKGPSEDARRIKGMLVFPDRFSNGTTQLAAQQLGKGRTKNPPGGGVWETPPGGKPACYGDGETALRFNGVKDGKSDYIEIPCPHKNCYFRNLGAKVCGAVCLLYFCPVWPNKDMPSVLVRYQSHSWKSTRNLKGMFDAVEQTARGMNLPDDSWCWTGLPFEMTLGIDANPDKGHRNPVASFAVGDIFSFLMWQSERRQQLLGASKTVTLIGDGMQHEEGTPESLADVLTTLTLQPGIPASVDEDIEPEDVPTDAKVVIVKPAQYDIEEGDPRTAYDRLLDYAKEVLGITDKELWKEALSSAPCGVTTDVPEEHEALIADQLDVIAKRESED